METITTATGKVFQSDFAVTIPHPAQAYIRILNCTEDTVRTVFSDPEETRQLLYGPQLLDGYTRLAFLFWEGEAIKICLEKE